MKIPAELADKKLLCPGCKKPFRISAAKFQQAESAAQQAASNAPAAPRAGSTSANAAAAGQRRSAAGTTGKPSPPASKPSPPPKKSASQPTELPQLPDPAELDLLPAELDWSGEISMSQSDILADFVPGANKGAASAVPAAPAKRVGRSCPMCKAALTAGARICIGCGYDLRDGTFVTGAGSFVRGPVDGSSSSLNPLGTASDRSSGQIPGVGAKTAKKQKRGFWARIAQLLFRPRRSKA